MAGFIVGQIPLTMLATKLPINLYLPIMDSLWAVFTLVMFNITNYRQLYALRFCFGLLGSFFFPTVQYILGSWYTKSEITKRSAFFCASQIDSMSGEYIQAAAYNSLNGVGGIAGLQWLYLGIYHHHSYFFIWNIYIAGPTRFYSLQITLQKRIQGCWVEDTRRREIFG